MNIIVLLNLIWHTLDSFFGGGGGLHYKCLKESIPLNQLLYISSLNELFIFSVCVMNKLKQSICSFPESHEPLMVHFNWQLVRYSSKTCSLFSVRPLWLRCQATLHCSASWDFAFPVLSGTTLPFYYCTCFYSLSSLAVFFLSFFFFHFPIILAGWYIYIPVSFLLSAYHQLLPLYAISNWL